MLLSIKLILQVTLDGLSPGVHYGEVQVLLDNSPEQGPIARLPVTVVKVCGVCFWCFINSL